MPEPSLPLAIAAATGFLGGALIVFLMLQRRLHLRERENARLDQHNEQLTQENQQLSTELERYRQQVVELESQRAALEARIEEQKRHNHERLAELENNRHQLKAEFEALAARLLEEKSRQFDAQSRIHLNEMLSPVRQQLQDFRQRIDAIHSEEQRQHGSLLQELKRLQEANQRLNEEARKLAQALKSDSRTQGTWGEIVLETVLERSGLRKGAEYEVQGSFRDADGRLLRPDVIVHLPDGKDIVIDSKVSLRAWQDYVGAADEAQSRAALERHLQSIRNHIDTLSAKSYEELPGINSLDFVLMFMPIEAAFSAAFQADPELFSHAFDKHIIVVTPTTLLATLRTIENMWRFERQQENVKHIVERAARLYDKLRLFLEDFDKIGRQLDTVRGSYDDARRKLTDGKGNLVQQAERMRALGVTVKKPLPEGYRDNDAEIDALPPD